MGPLDFTLFGRALQCPDSINVRRPMLQNVSCMIEDERARLARRRSEYAPTITNDGNFAVTANDNRSKCIFNTPHPLAWQATTRL